MRINTIDYEQNHKAVEEALSKGFSSLPCEEQIYNIKMCGLYGFDSSPNEFGVLE